VGVKYCEGENWEGAKGVHCEGANCEYVDCEGVHEVEILGMRVHKI
jgi:hypothetical protein